MQVTGAATGGRGVISMQGSDTNIGATITTKGTGSIDLRTNNGAHNQLVVTHTASAVNYAFATGAAAGAAPRFGVEGSDTNIDLALNPKGTGTVRVGAAFSTGTPLAVDSAANANSARGITFNIGGASFPFARVNVPAGSGGAFSIFTGDGSHESTEQFRVARTSSSAVNYVQVQGNTAGNAPVVSAQGSDSNITLRVASKGTNGISFSTNFDGTGTGNTQAVIAHTASAVNFVQVTGGPTGNYPNISATGSDANVGLQLRVKGAPTGPGFRIENNSGANFCFAVTTSGANVVNYMRADPAAAGSAAGMSSQGNDTNIDLALTPKGTGNVRFGTYTADMTLIVQGYVEIKDSGGTIRKLAVIA